MTGRETIAAVATPPGVGGLGLIRVSGPASEAIAGRLFRPHHRTAALISHRLYHGEIIVPETKAVLDDVLVAFMRGPRTYTGEDTLEISCHGGSLILRTVLAEILRAGARPAERGEFTKRAFLNGRLDLSQAEAVCDLILAKTPEGLSAAVDRFKGSLSGRIEGIRQTLIDLLAGIEVALDFDEDDGAVPTPVDLSDLQALIDDLHALAAACLRARITQEGVGVVIAGRPNVGKSSLLNRLLGERRAIVTPVPGTTRDFIEETADIGGIPVRLTDTAGIRLPENAIEEEGIDLVWERLAGADAVIVLLDGSASLTQDDRTLLGKIHAKPILPVINKSDLPQRLDEGALPDLLPDGAMGAVRISAKYGDGIDALRAAIREMALTTPADGSTEAAIAPVRHSSALKKAAGCLTRAGEGLKEGLSPELTALAFREALDALGEITGRTTPEEVLDRIFANFCVGK
ncbi:MAG: tRNA uridine-5-carboxymethylaminomethyl(34) synthesis GTPase MnmE [Thermodesulfobacteriota bacterium]